MDVSFGLKLEAVSYSQMLILEHQSKRCHIPDEIPWTLIVVRVSDFHEYNLFVSLLTLLPKLKNKMYLSLYFRRLRILRECHLYFGTLRPTLCTTSFNINTLRTGSFKLFKRPFPGSLTILTV